MGSSPVARFRSRSGGANLLLHRLMTSQSRGVCAIWPDFLDPRVRRSIFSLKNEEKTVRKKTDPLVLDAFPLLDLFLKKPGWEKTADLIDEAIQYNVRHLL